MQAITKPIVERQTAGEGIVFQEKISPVRRRKSNWVEKRNQAIRAFAEKWSLCATIPDSGMRITFRKLNS